MTRLVKLAAAALAGLGIMICAGAAPAADYPQAAAQVARELGQARQESAAQVAQRREDLAGLEAKLADMQARVAAEEAALEKASQRLAQAAKEKNELAQALREEEGDLKELAGLVRASARELLAMVEATPNTAFQPGQLDALRAYLSKSRFPGLEDIRRLVDMYFAHIARTGLVRLRPHLLVDQAGAEVEGQVLTLGPFTAAYKLGDKVGYLTLGPASGRLLAVGGELPWAVSDNLADYFAGQADAVYMDISGGAALRQLAYHQTWQEQLLSGGPLIWPILLVGLISLVLILERLFFLRRVRANTDQLMAKVNDLVQEGDFAGALAATESQGGRPTANVIQAGLALRGHDPTAIEMGLSEAMLKELPRLERFLTALKVMAAVAPLLGLLGTVTGMINTFQVITAHGAGDPRLMAGGISEALITTQLGLAVAIPVLVAASLLARRAQRIASDMEEKATAMSAALIQDQERS